MLTALGLHLSLWADVDLLTDRLCDPPLSHLLLGQETCSLFWIYRSVSHDYYSGACGASFSRSRPTRLLSKTQYCQEFYSSLWLNRQAYHGHVDRHTEFCLLRHFCCQLMTYRFGLTSHFETLWFFCPRSITHREEVGSLVFNCDDFSLDIMH